MRATEGRERARERAATRLLHEKGDSAWADSVQAGKLCNYLTNSSARERAAPRAHDKGGSAWTAWTAGAHRPPSVW
jgi:hypothetical protein